MISDVKVLMATRLELPTLRMGATVYHMCGVSMHALTPLIHVSLTS